MARQAQKMAQNTFNQAQSVAGNSQGNAQDIFNRLLPEYQKEISNPTGIGASGLAAEDTASQQSTGGAVAGAAGRGDLLAARTRNLGSNQSTGSASAREAMRINSQNAVRNQAENEKLKLEEASEGLRGEAGLYGTNMQEILGALGAQNNATNAYTDAGKSGWLQNTMGILGTLGQLGTGAGNFMTGWKA